ncbi:putative ABC transporter substrate-binding protein [Gordonia hirsuta DSM 44140 = NBRC 16056]|uniref:Putative ABC transporter substrate-binding protein n=1 Tax=Gordonia hirsuta DSM 44140 = NBRC 16056 TaxID=1121927 RepID=L7LAD1_9ACTN|nr:ABC transporter substrate-binding protein [Gordonia hirsuta]GAC57007.1 putative ABC transporter substrate-binding protein [Gordonia hirsuta DSM 44140 = NBRC 16056]
MIPGLSRRLAVAIALLLSVILAASGCSAPDEDAPRGGPVQVNTPQGPVMIPGTPQRIVTLGTQWIDTALAFGVSPVAYLDQNQILSKKPAPWVGDKLENSTALSMENLVAEIAKAKPDLILAEGYMATAQPEMYGKIKEIAPTIPGVTGKQIDPWDDMVTLFGTITHRTDLAEDIINRVNDAISRVTTDYPGLKDKTYALAYMFSSEQIQVMADPTDGAGILFAQLGLKVAPTLAAEFARKGEPRFPISTENVPMLDADLLAVTAGSEAMRAELRKLPGYANLKAVRDGAVADLSVTEITGLNQPSALSIPYLLDQLRPQFERAANAR